MTSPNSVSTSSLETARTFLFVPGDRPDRFDKALNVGADHVIIDLEDAVAPERKDDARAQVAAWLDPAKPVLVRINAEDTDAFTKDLEILQAPAISGLVLPKAESAEAIARLPKPVLPLIESARGMANLAEICAAPSVVRLIFGTIDFMVDIGVPDDKDGLNAFRSHIVLASRVAGLAAPADGVTADFSNETQLLSDTQRALAYGFSARLCIHPKQVAPIHAAMRPDDAQIAWAKRVINAAKTGGSGALQLDGQMIDRPVILKAEAILKRL